MNSLMPIDASEIKPRSRYGHAPLIYVMGVDEDGPVKIGTSSDIAKRVLTLQTGNALPLMVYAVRLVLPRFLPLGRDLDDVRLMHQEALRLEKAVHAELNSMRLRLMGEWFDLTSSEAVAVIDKVASVIRARAISKEWLLAVDAKLDPEIGFMRDDLLWRASSAEAQAAKINSLSLTTFERTGNL